MMMIMELSRGHSESVMKSERIGAAWQKKKREAAENGKPLTAAVPAWLRLVDGKWEVDEEAASAVRLIYRLAADGHGSAAVARRLNGEGVPAIGRKAHWTRAYVAKILSGRLVLGEYQPHAGKGRKRRPDGEPIANYYPAVIDEPTWLATRAVVLSKHRPAGRTPKGVVNVFSGLLHAAGDGGSIHMKDESLRGGGSRKVLVSYRALNGEKGSKFVTFPFDVFTDAVLQCLKEVDARDILPSNGHEDRVLALSKQLAGVEAEIEKVKVRLEKSYSDGVADVLQRHEARRKKIAADLADARQEAASPLGAAWGDCGSLLAALRTADDRVKLRSVLRRITESIWCLFVARGKVRLAAVQCWFAGGKHRDYLIVHQGGWSNGKTHHEAKWWVRSLAEAAPAPLDLRKRKDARDLERALADLDLTGQSA
jgi:hypothetical protein